MANITCYFNSASVSDHSSRPSTEKDLNFIVMSLVAVILFIIVSWICDYYPKTVREEVMVLYGLILFSLTTFVISLYVTYQFTSSDLLITSVGHGLVIKKIVQRRWVIKFRQIHHDAPVWRSHQAMMVKIMCREPQVFERPVDRDLELMRTTDFNFTGRAYSMQLTDQSEAFFIHDKNCRSDSESFLRGDLMKKARMGEASAQRALAASSMANSTTMPAKFRVGTGDYNAARGSAGAEVANVHSYLRRDLEQLEFFSVNDRSRFVEFTRQEDLIIFFHVKLAEAYFSRNSTGNDDSWMEIFCEWCSSEVFVGNLPLPDTGHTIGDQRRTQGRTQLCEQSVHLQNALAYGVIHGCPEGAQKYWYRLKQDDAAQFQLERTSSWRKENDQIVKLQRRPLQSEERKRPTQDGNAFHDELLDGTAILLKYEENDDYWEQTDSNWLQLKSATNDNAYDREPGGALFIFKDAERAYRMMKKIELPATIHITDELVAAIHQEPGQIVSKAWNVSIDEIANMNCFRGRGANGAYEFHWSEHLDMAKVLLLQSAVFNEKCGTSQLNWFAKLCHRLKNGLCEEQGITAENYSFERLWLLGEVLIESEDDETPLEGIALAYWVKGANDNRKVFLLPRDIAVEVAKRRSRQLKCINTTPHGSDTPSREQ